MDSHFNGGSKFSSEKALWHIDRIATLRKGQDIVPTHVQLILSDLCNQNCFVAGTMIESPHGEVPIEEIQIGQKVIGPDGKEVCVTAVGNRLANDLYQVTINGNTLKVTGEHPFLTQEGWKPVQELRSDRHRVAVRVRVRPTAEMESEKNEVGKVCVRSFQNSQENCVLGMEEKSPRKNNGGDSPPLPMWLRKTGSSTSPRVREVLVELSKRASTYRENRVDERRSEVENVGKNEEQQSDEKFRSGKKGIPHPTPVRIANESGTQILSLVKRERIASEFQGNRTSVGQSEEPGFSSSETEKSNRDNDKRYFQRRGNRKPYGGHLRCEGNLALRTEWMEMSSDLLPRGLQTQTAEIIATGTPRLLLEGIELERGMELRSIDSIQRIEGEFVVYNFSCPPIESYIANNVAVHNCHFCAYRMDGGFSTEQFADEEGNKNPHRIMPTEKAIEILDDCAAMGVKAIEFTGGGEPTVHPQCYNIIGHAQSLGMETGLVTNAVKLGKNSAVENLTWLRISLDSGSEATYAKVRQSYAWNTVIKKMEYAATLTTPYVGVGFVVTRENYNELALAAALIKRIGIPYIRISAMFSNEGSAYYDGIRDEIVAELALCKRMQDDKFKVVDFFDERIGDLDQGRPDYKFCGEQQFVLYIGGDQKVYRCCTTSYSKHGEIGDLHEQGFASWMKSYRRYDFDSTGCHHCQFNSKNRAINWALSTPPHVNFV